MKAPVGAFVRIYYDGRPLSPGDYLLTPTGRLYQVITVRVQQRGKHRGRQHLRCLVDETPIGGRRVLPLHWYPRVRRVVARRRSA